MPRFLGWAICATALATTLVAAQQVPTFRSGTNTVSLYTTVVDQSGHLKTDLTRDDFDVYDNGVRQDLSVFANDVQPITIVVMLDRSGSMYQNFDLERHAAEEFVRHLLPADRARIGSFSNRIQIDPVSFTSDQTELLRILATSLQGMGPTPLWNATSAAMTALAHEEGRRVVLVFTDGKDSPERYEVSTSFGAVKTRAEVEETMIYAIGMASQCASAAIHPVNPGGGGVHYQGRVPGPGASGRAPGRMPGGFGIPRPPIGIGGFGGGRPAPPPPPPPPPHGPGMGGGRLPMPGDPWGITPVTRETGCVATKPDPDLKELATNGGGGYFELDGPTDLAATFTRVADELHHQYLLAFPASNLDGKMHKLEVQVHDPHLTARARRSYLAAAR